MLRSISYWGFAFLICAMFGVQSASAQFNRGPGAPEFFGGIGYDNISLGSNSPISDEGALRFSTGMSAGPIPSLPQLRFGADVGWAMIFDNSTRTVISHNGGLIIAGSSEVPLWLLEPELTLSFRQWFGKKSPSFFVEPGIAGGGAFGFFQLRSVTNPDVTYSENSTTGYGKAYVRAGMVSRTGVFGLEGSYLRGGQLDFGQNINGELQEWYVGIYGAIKF